MDTNCHIFKKKTKPNINFKTYIRRFKNYTVTYKSYNVSFINYTVNYKKIHYIFKWENQVRDKKKIFRLRCSKIDHKIGSCQSRVTSTTF